MPIPLPALDVAQQQPQQNNLLSQYGQLLQLKNAIQNAPLERQRLQQQLQAGQLGIQQEQQQQQDQQELRAAMSDPSMKGKTIGEIADVLAQKGAITMPSYMAAKKADLEHSKSIADLTEKQLTNAKAAHDQTQNLFDNVMNMPDDQVAANWGNIAQQFNSIPGQSMKLDPNQPLSKQQISQFGPMISMGNSYLDQELARRQKAAGLQETQAKASLAQTQAERGGTTDLDKFQFDYMKSHNLPDTPQNRQRAFAEYTRQTKIVPAQVRVEGFANTREYPVIDTKNGNALIYASASDINAANKVTPGRFTPAGPGMKALGQTSLIEDIRGNINAVRTSLKNEKMPEFTAQQRAEIAIALGKSDANGALESAFRGGVLGSLTPEQQDYLINMAQLKENAMAMRSVLGAGQGSEDLRSAIAATIPGPRTPSKAYAGKQLDAFENVLNRLSRGVANVPLRNIGPNNQNSPSPQPQENSGDPFAQFGGKKH